MSFKSNTSGHLLHLVSFNLQGLNFQSLTSSIADTFHAEMHFITPLLFLQEMRWSQLRPLRLRSLSQRGTLGGRKVIPFIN